MPKRVMVLEDEPVLLDLLQDLLGIEGFEVVKPAKLDNLVEEMRAEPPDALLIDVNLKGASGLDLLDKIRADAQLKDKYVVMTSGMDYRRESLAHGANDFLMKPYMPDELVKLLKDKLNP